MIQNTILITILIVIVISFSIHYLVLFLSYTIYIQNKYKYTMFTLK